MHAIRLARSAGLAALLPFAIAACGGTNDPPADGGPGDAGPQLAAPPAAPAPAMLLPCAPGWVAHEVRMGVMACDPGGESAACGPGEAWLPGAVGCAPIGHVCPADGWPADLMEAANVRFVRAGASGGDGTSRATPVATILEALAGAPPGTVIAIATGNYPEFLSLRAGVELRGACASGTRIGVATGAATTPIIDVRVRDAALVDVGIVPVDSIGIVVDTGSLRVEGVSIEDATAVGLAALDADISGRGLLVRGVTPLSDGTYGFGLTSILSGTTTLSNVVIERASGDGLQFSGAVMVTLADVAVRDTQSTSTFPGTGVDVMRGAQVELTHADIGGSAQAGVLVLDAETRVVVSDALIRDTEGSPGGRNGEGAAVQGGTLELHRVHVLRSHSEGVNARDDGRLIAQDLIVEDTRESTDGQRFAFGIGASLGAMVMVERALLVDSARAGIFAGGGAGTFEDVSIAAAPDAIGGSAGIGLGRGDYTVRRALVESNAGAGIVVTGSPAEVTFEDLLVRDIRPRPDGTFGRGLEASDGVIVHLARARFERVSELGVIVAGGSTRVDAVDLAVVDTVERACVRTTCVGEGGGSALASLAGAALRVERFSIHTAPLCGAQVASGAALDLRTGEIRGASVGACVQVDGYDITRLTDGVAFVANGLNVDASDFYIPEPNTDLSF